MRYPCWGHLVHRCVVHFTGIVQSAVVCKSRSIAYQPHMQHLQSHVTGQRNKEQQGDSDNQINRSKPSVASVL